MLRVAFAYRCNMQQIEVSSATPMQQSLQERDIKALASRVLDRVERNKRRNTNATAFKTTCNKMRPDNDQFVVSKTTYETQGNRECDFVLQEVIKCLPVSLTEVKSSSLFDEHDLKQGSHRRRGRIWKTQLGEGRCEV